MIPVRDEDASGEVAFLEGLQRLLSEGDFSSTYKFALLIALTELSSEAPPPSSDEPHPFPTPLIAEKVIRLYWPQVRPFAPDRRGTPHLLLQNRGAQAAIIRLIHGFQNRALGGRIPPTHLDGLIQAHSAAWRELLWAVEWKLIEMPLPRLQNLPSGPSLFIYSINWTVDDVEPYGGRLRAVVRAYQRADSGAFDNRVMMQPGVVNIMRRLRGIIRDLVEARWVLEVRKIDPTVREAHSLRDHMFGLERRHLAPVKKGLVEIQDGVCFYCGRKPRAHHVDHFLPHSLSRADFIENLVVACSSCNSAKSAHLAADQHVGAWMERLYPGHRPHSELRAFAGEIGWPQQACSTLYLAQLLYGQHPERAGLWHSGKVFRPWSKPGMLMLFEKAIEEHCSKP